MDVDFVIRTVPTEGGRGGRFQQSCARIDEAEGLVEGIFGMQRRLRDEGLDKILVARLLRCRPRFANCCNEGGLNSVYRSGRF